MNQQDDQIKQLEESNRELKRQIELQAKQIEALKSSSTQSDEERFAPYRGEGWGVGSGPDGVYIIDHNPDRQAYYAYPTEQQAKWEDKATQVRRKLQRICAVLGPFKDGYRTFTAMEVETCIKFARLEDAQKAKQILGDDLKYLNWIYNSPEAKDAREGRE